uniref:BING4 C-terminal domain-containing protein n=1 Tax=Paramoeba aestuarina TaxID=180227 RepID=A0A7S4KP52_9EUKA
MSVIMPSSSAEKKRNRENRYSAIIEEEERQKKRRRLEKKKEKEKGKEKEEKREEDSEEEDEELLEEQKEAYNKFKREGQKLDLDKVKNKRLKTRLKREERDVERAALAAAKAELLLTHEGGYLEAEGYEKTSEVSQKEIKEAVDIQSAVKSFSLKLDELGPYSIDYSKNGRNLLLGGRKGHLAMIDWHSAKILAEVQVRETVRDVCFLHDHTMWAAAQKKYIYLYDHGGVELHCLKKHVEPRRLQFLPYHFLLVSVGERGQLVYQDTSTGGMVFNAPTKMGTCDCMAQNPRNAVIHLGHSNGVVSLWTPNNRFAAVKMLAHKGSLLSIGIEREGNYMATSGLDGKLKIWDLRMYKALSETSFVHPAHTLAFSQRKMLATGHGPLVQIWKEPIISSPKDPYMQQRFDNNVVENVKFCPYEDVLGAGHAGGFDSLLVPGSGEPNYDTYEADPFESLKQRRESTVKKLLEKVQPDTITLPTTHNNNNNIGTVNINDMDGAKLEDKSLRLKEIEKTKKEKRKARGKSKIQAKMRKKEKKNVSERRAKKVELNIVREEKEKKRESEKGEEIGEANGEESGWVVGWERRRFCGEESVRHGEIGGQRVVFAWWEEKWGRKRGIFGLLVDLLFFFLFLVAPNQDLNLEKSSLP